LQRQLVSSILLEFMYMSLFVVSIFVKKTIENESNLGLMSKHSRVSVLQGQALPRSMLGQILDDCRRRVLARLTQERRAWPF
jgi:hypothetical protein